MYKNVAADTIQTLFINTIYKHSDWDWYKYLCWQFLTF